MKMWRKKQELAKRSASDIVKEVKALSQQREQPLVRDGARLEHFGKGLVVLADCSESMNDWVGSARKIDILRKALAQLPRRARLIAFNSVAEMVSSIPDASGSTALHLALKCARNFRPQRVVVISDGYPDNPKAALAEARKLNCQIEIIYCGQDGDKEGINFMNLLAQQGSQPGQVTLGNFTQAKALSKTVQRAIGALPPKT